MLYEIKRYAKTSRQAEMISTVCCVNEAGDEAVFNAGEIPDGWTPVEGSEAPEVDSKSEAAESLSKMTKADLITLADDEGVEIDAKATKAEIVEAIAAKSGKKED